MAKKKLPKAAEPYKFKKGKSGNPEGGRAHNPAIRALKNLTIETYREIIELVLTGNLAQLEKLIKDESSSALQVGVATAFAQAIKAGDYEVIERIAERIVGKIPEVIHVKSDNVNKNIDTLAAVKEGLSKERIAATLAELEKSV